MANSSITQAYFYVCGSHPWKTCRECFTGNTITNPLPLFSPLESSETLGLVMAVAPLLLFLPLKLIVHTVLFRCYPSRLSQAVPLHLLKPHVWLTARLSVHHYFSITFCKAHYTSRWPFQYPSSPSSSFLQWLCPLAHSARPQSLQLHSPHSSTQIPVCLTRPI